MKGVKCYISCPMSEGSIVAVKTWLSVAMETLRRHGYIPVLPLEANENISDEYNDAVGKDITALLECDAVFFLSGWHNDRECRLEYAAARIYDKKIMFE